MWWWPAWVWMPTSWGTSPGPREPCTSFFRNVHPAGHLNVERSTWEFTPPSARTDHGIIGPLPSDPVSARNGGFPSLRIGRRMDICHGNAWVCSLQSPPRSSVEVNAEWSVSEASRVRPGNYFHRGWSNAFGWVVAFSSDLRLYNNKNTLC